MRRLLSHLAIVVSILAVPAAAFAATQTACDHCPCGEKCHCGGGCDC